MPIVGRHAADLAGATARHVLAIGKVEAAGVQLRGNIVGFFFYPVSFFVVKHRHLYLDSHLG
jgi:hypothetical protein